MESTKTAYVSEMAIAMVNETIENVTSWCKDRETEERIYSEMNNLLNKLMKLKRFEVEGIADKTLGEYTSDLV